MPDEVIGEKARLALNAQLRGGSPAAVLSFRSGRTRPSRSANSSGTTAKFRYWFRIITRLPMI